MNGRTARLLRRLTAQSVAPPHLSLRERVRASKRDWLSRPRQERSRLRRRILRALKALQQP